MVTLVVGDVHGCADELVRMVGEVRPDRLVLVGDLYTKGPDPAGVWEVIRAHRAQATLGNHDARLLEVIEGRRGRDRHGADVIGQLDAFDPAWREHLQRMPLFLRVGRFTVVHAGLHPREGVAGTTRSMALNMRRFPVDQPDAPLWHERYEGSEAVIFGHDAKTGLVHRLREDRTQVLGLDTGCVYGGALSGYVVEDGSLIQVPAARVYRPVG